MRPRILREAELEFHEAMLFYEDRREGLGEAFLDALGVTLTAIGQNPLQFPIYEAKRFARELRRARIAKFPYILVFEIREDETLIVAVAHTSRKPGNWDERV